MNKIKKKAWATAALLLLNLPAWAQESLRTNLYDAYQQLIPFTRNISDGVSLIAGIGSLIYLFTRVYKMLALEEQFDVIPLLKPFGIGLLLIFYPGLLALINGICSIPTNFTNALVGESSATVEQLINSDIKETPGWKWYIGDSNPGNYGNYGNYDAWLEDNSMEEEGWFGISSMIQFSGERMEFVAKQLIRDFAYELSSILFFVASLSIDLARIFFLIVLSMMGPFSIAISLFDITSGSIATWLTRYVHIYLWLPVANIYGFLINQIQINMIQDSFVQMAADGSSTLNTTDLGYIVFLLFAACGYLTIPSVTAWIVAPGHQGAAAMRQANMVGAAAGAVAGSAGASIAYEISKPSAPKAVS